jgi:hypothetical protein
VSITLPKRFEDWPEAEVRAGRAKSVDALALRAGGAQAPGRGVSRLARRGGRGSRPGRLARRRNRPQTNGRADRRSGARSRRSKMSRRTLVVTPRAQRNFLRLSNGIERRWAQARPQKSRGQSAPRLRRRRRSILRPLGGRTCPGGYYRVVARSHLVIVQYHRRRSPNLPDRAWLARHSVIACGRIARVYFFTKIAFGIIMWTPLLPSTTWVIDRSPATLVSM